MPGFGWIETPFEKKNLHAQQYNWLTLYPQVTAAVEKVFKIPPEFVQWYDQDNKGACVGAGSAQLMAALNIEENVALHYDWWEHYCWACANDNDSSTTCQRDLGTYSFAGLDCLRKMGAYVYGKGWDTSLGIDRYFWVTSQPVDSCRTAINENQLIGTGGPFFQEWITKLVKKGDKYYTPPRSKWKKVAGGHFFGWYDALDSEQVFGFVNTWGNDYPGKVYMPYADYEYWLTQVGAECAVLVDKDFNPPPPPPPPPPADTRTINLVVGYTENNITWAGVADVKLTRSG